MGAFGLDEEDLKAWQESGFPTEAFDGWLQIRRPAPCHNLSRRVVLADDASVRPQWRHGGRSGDMGVSDARVRESGRLVGGKGRIEQRAAHLITWTNGKIERFKHYPDLDEARAAAERLAQERG